MTKSNIRNKGRDIINKGKIDLSEVVDDESFTRLAGKWNFQTKPKDNKKAVLSYFKEIDSDKHAHLKTLKDHRFMNLGGYAYILKNIEFTPTGETFFSTTIEKLMNTTEVTSVSYSDPSKPTQKDINNQVAGNIIGSIDEHLDLITYGYYNPAEVDLNELKKFEINSLSNQNKQVLKKVYAEYVPVMNEFNLILSGKGDEQLKEATELNLEYQSNYLEDIKSQQEFLVKLIDFLGKMVAPKKSQKQLEKQANKKSKQQNKKLEKLNYLSDFAELGLISKDPKKIEGSKEMWIYNTHLQSMKVLYASGDDGLNFKGSTIIDFDEEKSFEKRIKKPQAWFSNVNTGLKSNLKKSLKEVKTNLKTTNGRINGHCIILGIF